MLNGFIETCLFLLLDIGHNLQQKRLGELLITGFISLIMSLEGQVLGQFWKQILRKYTFPNFFYRSSFRQGIISYSNYRQLEPVLAIELISDGTIRNSDS